MVDTRCANPDYQLDVDTMMLEYVAFKAVASHVQLFKEHGLEFVPNIHDALYNASHDMDEAAKLTETFSILMKSFKLHHPHANMSEGLHVDILFLKFMTLLRLWLDQGKSEGIAISCDPEMRQNLHRDQRTNTYFRNFWLCARNRSDHPSLMPLMTAHDSKPEPCLADHLLPLFMFISATLSKGNTDLSEKWMELAADFMVQAAIELLDTPSLFVDGPNIARSNLERCFAWGYVPRQTYERNEVVTSELIEHLDDKDSNQANSGSSLDEHVKAALCREDECWRMFFVEGQGASSDLTEDENDPPSSGEVPQWTQVRQKMAQNVLTTFQMLVEDEDFKKREPVSWLRNRFKLSHFLKCLGEFIIYSWQETHSPRGYEQPILVQIEQGHLVGLSSEEFQDFIAKAGIGEQQYLFS